MKKIIPVFLSLIINLSSLTMLNCVAVGYDLKKIPINEFTVIDTCDYFTDDDITILKASENAEELLNKSSQYTLPLYFCKLYSDTDFSSAKFEFLCYSLKSDEDYNIMSNYLNVNYPDYNLEKIEETDEHCLYFGYEEKKYRIVSDKTLTEKEMFEIGAKIKNDLGYEFDTIFEQNSCLEIDFSGETNNDFSVDIADVVAISAYIGNPEVNALSEQAIINGDVHNTGDGLTANDALLIQQYLAGDIESF